MVKAWVRVVSRAAAILSCSALTCGRANAEPHSHDGFYLRMALGVGRLSVAGKFDEVDFGVRETNEVTGSGLSNPIEFAMGGTVLPGLVIGGAIWGESAVVSTTMDLRIGSFRHVAEQDFNVALGSIGPFVDWYFIPTQGFHAQLAVARSGFVIDNLTCVDFAIPTVSGETCAGDDTAVGPSITIGAGWEGWVGDEWSIGLLGRVTYAHLSSGLDWDYTVLALPSILATATYH